MTEMARELADLVAQPRCLARGLKLTRCIRCMVRSWSVAQPCCLARGLKQGGQPKVLPADKGCATLLPRKRIETLQSLRRIDSR